MTQDAETEAAVAGAREAMEGFMAAFNAQDDEAMRTRWLHFPHVRFHSGKVTAMQRPSDYASLVRDPAAGFAGWSRTAWDYVEPVDAGPDKVHFRVRFTRYGADGRSIGSYRSLYIVTRVDGRWAVQARSSWAA